MCKIRLLADSALHSADTELTIVSDDVGVHAMDCVTLSHATHLIASGLAEYVTDTPGPADEAPLPVVMAVPDEATVAEYEEQLEPAPFFRTAAVDWRSA